MDALKQAWEGMPVSRTSPAALRGMIHRHPARMAMRKQLLFEMIPLVLFLIVYYDFFDGGLKPWYINALLVSAVAFVILLNAAGYLFSRQALQGDHLQEMVHRHLVQLRRFAIISVAARVGMAACLLVFFCYGILLTEKKIWLLVLIGLITTMQAIWLGTIWKKRIRLIRQTIEE